MLFRVSIVAAALLASVTIAHVEAELSSVKAQTSVSSQEFVETKDTRIRLTALLLSKRLLLTILTFVFSNHIAHNVKQSSKADVKNNSNPNPVSDIHEAVEWWET